MGTVHGVIGDNGTRRELSVSIDYGSTTNHNLIQSEVAIAFDAESTDERGVDRAAILESDEIEFTKPRFLVNTDVLADMGAEHAVIEFLE